MPQASTVTTDIGRQQAYRLAIGDAGVGTLNGFEIALGQSAAISGGADITEATTTSYVEISAAGTYSANALTAGTNFVVNLSGGTVTLHADSQSWTPSGAAFDPFDQVLLVADIGGTKYVWAQWPTDAERNIAASQPYETGAIEAAIA
jgi:hypothetical protein